MKNFKLLLASTAILSTGALIANAEDTLYSGYVALHGPSAKLKAVATLINSLEVREVSPLSFGGIIKPTGGQKVAVTATGLDPSLTTANVINSGFVTHDSSGVIVSNNAVLTLAPGEIKISGSYFADNGLNQQNSEVTAYPIFNTGTDIRHVPLKSGEILCGEVDFAPENVTYSNVQMSSDFKTMTYKYGGILTLADGIEDNVPANGSLKCEGSVTVTTFGIGV